MESFKRDKGREVHTKVWGAGVRNKTQGLHLANELSYRDVKGGSLGKAIALLVGSDKL